MKYKHISTTLLANDTNLICILGLSEWYQANSHKTKQTTSVLWKSHSKHLRIFIFSEICNDIKSKIMGILLFIPVDCKLHDRRIWIHNGQPHMFLCACDWDWEWLPVKSVDLLLWQFCMVQISEQHTIAQLHNRAKVLFNRLLQLNGAHKHRWTYTFSSGLWISISNISMAGFMAGLRIVEFYRGKIEFVYEDHGKCGQYSNVLNWHLWCLASLSPSLSFAHYLSLCSASPSESLKTEKTLECN